jgi:iron complex transport system substrate-binding protein
MLWKSVLILMCLSLFIMAGSAERVTVVDFENNSLTVDAPVHRIVSLASGATEIICALDGGQSLVGKGSISTFPPSIANVTDVGRNSASPDLELILELNPDLLIADTMLSDENKKTLEDAGIPVIVERFMMPERITTVVENMGILMGNSERAQEINGFIENHQILIQERTSGLKPEDMPTFFYESSPSTPYKTFSSSSSFDDILVAAGGVNIAVDLDVSSPEVTPEWVVQTDPDVIIQRQSSDEDFTEDDLKELRDAITSREELENVKAIKDGRVYIITGKVATGVRSIVGELYLAKWFHPDLFEDIEPQEVHEDLLMELYGLNLEGAYAYPST